LLIQLKKKFKSNNLKYKAFLYFAVSLYEFCRYSLQTQQLVDFLGERNKIVNQELLLLLVFLKETADMASLYELSWDNFFLI
jgi:hypothetical protein